MLDLNNKQVVVIGLGRTGTAVAEYCLGLGARVLVLEQSERPADAKVKSLRSQGAKVLFGPHTAEALKGADVVIPSPGVPPHAPILEEASDMGLPMISEIELAFSATDRPVISITGTNGKTTTTTLIGEIFKAAGKEADVCGNIGRPMIEAVGRSRGKGEGGRGKKSAPFIVEVSSFQLHFTDKFRPQTAVLLNLTPDHLDWHGTIEAYREAKLKMFRRQRGGDWAVVLDALIPLVENEASGKVPLGRRGGVWVEGGWLRQEIVPGPADILPVEELFVPGAHNQVNAAAAAAVALLHGIDIRIIGRALKEFKGVEHRLEFVVQANGILFYNDSKATNPEAAITALTAFHGVVILLAGGRNKGNDFEPLAAEAAGKVKLGVVFGESAPDLTRAFSGYGINVTTAGSLEESVATAVGRAAEGDIVLLSPACASYDMFRDYEERGRCFKEAVLKETGILGRA